MKNWEKRLDEIMLHFSGDKRVAIKNLISNLLIKQRLDFIKTIEEEKKNKIKDWYYEGDELVIKKGSWVIDRYKRHTKVEI